MHHPICVFDFVVLRKIICACLPECCCSVMFTVQMVIPSPLRRYLEGEKDGMKCFNVTMHV